MAHHAPRLVVNHPPATAFALDAHSRRIVGRRAVTRMRADLPPDALEMALWRQKIVLS
ncbi:hypothetical protein [Kitasatospora sp. NPDC086791]|uniref:hypothetical protein n=1 Tax=Kitasatospora sp. NPDC086791 TaxID=3155178 RepID=UPI003420566E